MDYIDSLVPSRPSEMQAMETEAEWTNFPIIGPASGYLCYQVARMISAKRVFELGSGFGYSTAWFARAVTENGGGEVYHVVWDEDLSRQARTHLTALGYDEHYSLPCGGGGANPARNVRSLRPDLQRHRQGRLSQLASGYRRETSPGGVLIVDNMLWHGRIFDGKDQTPATKGIRKLTGLLTRSPEWVTSLVPVRDGVMLAYKV